MLGRDISGSRTRGLSYCVMITLPQMTASTEDCTVIKASNLYRKNFYFFYTISFIKGNSRFPCIYPLLFKHVISIVLLVVYPVSAHVEIWLELVLFASVCCYLLYSGNKTISLVGWLNITHNVLNKFCKIGK